MSPPPDLVVSSLEAEAVYTTGDTLRVVFNVTNNGAGEPFERYWNDELVSFAYLRVTYVLTSERPHTGKYYVRKGVPSKMVVMIVVRVLVEYSDVSYITGAHSHLPHTDETYRAYRVCIMLNGEKLLHRLNYVAMYFC